MQRILILRFSSLGDVVLMSTLLDGIQNGPDPAEIWVVTKAEFGSLYREDPRVARVVTLERGQNLSTLVRTLESVAFDLILDAHGSLRSRLLCAALPPTPTRTIGKDAVARWLFATAKLRTRSLRKRQVDRFAALLGPGAMRWRPRIVLSPRHRQTAAELVSRSARLVVAPGAKHETKRWPAAAFAATASQFAQDGVIVVGSASEAPLCREVATAIGETAQVVTGVEDLAVLAALLASGDLLLCNDSGLMHLAEAVGTPVLSVFGPTSREFGFFPLDPNSRVVEHALPCRPCSRTGSAACKMTERWCMTRSTPTLVSSQMEVQWQRLSAMSTSPPS